MHENLLITHETIGNYSPSENEEYMCLKHRQYFKEKLLAWHKELMGKSELFFELKENGIRSADIIDLSAQQAEVFADFSSRERQSKLLQEIDFALARIEAGEYGYCEITGEDIGLKRLEARPVATRCIEAQEQFERLSNMRAGAVTF
jgi:DnaK suppressor protein